MKIKKLIAREVLILLGIVIVGLAIYFIGKHLNSLYLSEHPDARFKIIENMEYRLLGYTPYVRTTAFGLNIAIFGYPVIAFIRFILWAIKTLKEK